MTTKMMPNDVEEYAAMRLNLTSPMRGDDQRDDGADEAEVKAGVEQVVFIFQQPELHARRDLLPADFRQFHQARDVEQRLQHEKQQQGQ